MLIRFVVENVFSFGERKEFNMLPYKRLKTLKKHLYKRSDIDILKMASLYGANGAGKSNLIKAFSLFQKLILKEDIPLPLKDSHFKLDSKKRNEDQLFAIEFIQDATPYYYALMLSNDIIKKEELYQSGLGKTDDELIYERETDEDGNSSINFFDEFGKSEKNQLLKSLLLEEFVQPNEPILKLLSNRENKALNTIKIAYKWFEDTLQIITPDSKPRALAHWIDMDKEFKRYAIDLMCSFNLGISSLSTDKKEINKFFGEDDSDAVDLFTKKIEESPRNMLEFGVGGKDIVIVKEDDDIFVKEIQVGHQGIQDNNVMFDLDDESDGTIRLLDFVPAFKEVISKRKVFIVDEFERSIHPLLIKELVSKFSLDEDTQGQLVFTTHESNLLDQELFRQDEIWFVEKDNTGSSDLYSLSEFSEHKSIDIRKGYLSGRYGSIPFMGNLEDLNWHKYDTDKQAI